jgi:hypothetical protein
MKKWLSYREYSFLKRPLTLAEAEEVQAMTRRLASLCLLQPELDANYRKTKSATWQGSWLHNPQKSWHTASEGFPDSLSYTSLHINITKARHPSNAAVHTQLRAAAAYLQNPVPMKANRTSVAKPLTALDLF